MCDCDWDPEDYARSMKALRELAASEPQPGESAMVTMTRLSAQMFLQRANERAVDALRKWEILQDPTRSLEWDGTGFSFPVITRPRPE